MNDFEMKVQAQMHFNEIFGARKAAEFSVHLQETIDGLTKNNTSFVETYHKLKKEKRDLIDKYNKLVSNRFEHEYRNRPSMRCKCCPVPIKDDTPKSGHNLAATKIWNFSTETWDPL